MAKNSKELADALGAMMNGEVPQDPSDESGHHEAPVAPPPQSQPKPVAKAPPAAPAKAPQPVKAAPPPPPAAPSPARPAAAATPMRRPAPVPNPVPAPPKPPAAVPQPAVVKRPSRPAVPQPAPVPAKPAAPSVAKPAARSAAPSTAPAAVEPIEYAKPASKKHKKVPFFATLEFRQTVIPPLLAGGGGLIVLGILYFLQPSDAALRQLGATVPLVVGLIGVVLIGMGVLNMTKVKQQLIERAAEKAAKSKARKG